jgi:hypothetical protein
LRTAKIATIEMTEAARIGQLANGDRLQVAARLRSLLPHIA